MKLQKFIESYQRKTLETPDSRSPDRPYIFKTSESIGTLNSHDQFATDRSFIVKQQTNNRAQNFQLQHLKQLCTSQSSKQQKAEKTSQIKHISMFGAEGHKSNKKSSKSSHLGKISPIGQPIHGLSTPKAAQSLNKMGESIIFEGNFQSQEGLYEQAPSSIQKVQIKEQDQMLQQEVSWFYSLYHELISKVASLQTQNLALEQQLLRIEGQGMQFSKSKSKLGEEVSDLRENVGFIIQQNIQIQNKIKQILLREQMQRMKFFQSSEHILDSIDESAYQLQLKQRV